MTFPPHFRRALAMFQPYRGRLALAFLGMILTAATEPMFPAVMRVLLDRGFVGKPSLQLWMVPVAVIGIFVLRGFSTFLTSYMMTWVTTMLLNAIRAQMFARVLDVPASFYASSSVGKVINGMMFEAQQVIDMVRNVLTSLVRDSLTVIVLLAFLLWLNWRLTIVAAVLLPLTAVVVRLTGKRVRKLTREYLEIMRLVYSLAARTYSYSATHYQCVLAGEAGLLTLKLAAATRRLFSLVDGRVLDRLGSWGPARPMAWIAARASSSSTSPTIPPSTFRRKRPSNAATASSAK